MSRRRISISDVGPKSGHAKPILAKRFSPSALLELAPDRQDQSNLVSAVPLSAEYQGSFPDTTVAIHLMEGLKPTGSGVFSNFIPPYVENPPEPKPRRPKAKAIPFSQLPPEDRRKLYRSPTGVGTVALESI